MSDVEQTIADGLAALHRAAADGRITDAQVAYVERAEQSWGQGNEATRVMFARYLARCLAEPGRVGVHEATARCRCGDLGMIQVDDTGHGTWRPCDRCNPGAYRLWADRHFTAGHRCNLCSGRRRAPNSDPRTETDMDRRARDTRMLRDELI